MLARRFPTLRFGIVRVPAVYLTWANPVFLAFFSFNRINNLRVFNVAFGSIPTAPTNHLLEQSLQLSRLQLNLPMRPRLFGNGSGADLAGVEA